ncbi:MAG: bifunctional hydroxymethylpyrimidine kinase/phosphomethylpyrimidine kinase [Spirochaetaceae bacterium]|nr:bifunctional hydroxymethylpyrimidine kinase/phosphomethylpyrimidine kinase [Spirochaetaceae bacterium]
MKCVLTIAGSDCSGGAGIQADLKTMICNNVYGMSVITALTAQNTTGVFDIHEVDSDFVASQIDAVFSDIVPDAVKIGMVSNVSIIKVIAKKLKQYSAKNIVLDPVMVATSGASLISNDAKETLVKELFPLASIITPNIPEAEVLSGISIHNEDDIKKALEKISEFSDAAILVKGGHNVNDATDTLYYNKAISIYKSQRIDTRNTHGTGCTLSSAIASNLAKGYGIEESIKNAKDYITLVLENEINLGKSSGPLNHGYFIASKY